MKKRLKRRRALASRPSEMPIAKNRKIAKNTFKHLKAPKELSLLTNPEALVSYVVQAEFEMARGQNIVLDFERIDTMTPEAIPFIIAHVSMLVKTYKKASLSGIFPLKKDLQAMFRRSGFYDFVRTNVPYRQRVTTNLLFNRITHHKVENEDAKRACIEGVNHSFTIPRLFSPLYEVIIEMMANTNNHASPDGTERHDWWLNVYKYQTEKRTSYSFVDLGVGVFKSLNQNPIFNFLLGVKNDEKLRKIFDGKVVSRTRKMERGKGMPLIYGNSKEVEFSKFVFISNNVWYNLKTGDSIILSVPLSGTFYFWELIDSP